MESIDEKDQSFPVSPNDFPPASVVTPINEKTPQIDFTLLNTPKNHKPNNNVKEKQIRENHINTMVKNDKVTHLRITILITYIKILEI